MGREIVNCIELAKDGIHAVLVVFSVRTRFTREEEGVLQKFQNYFGEKITNYVIVVFTGGDELEQDDVTLEEYIGSCCPDPLLVSLFSYFSLLSLSSLLFYFSSLIQPFKGAFVEQEDPSL